MRYALEGGEAEVEAGANQAELASVVAVAVEATAAAVAATAAAAAAVPAAAIAATVAVAIAAVVVFAEVNIQAFNLEADVVGEGVLEAATDREADVVAVTAAAAAVVATAVAATAAAVVAPVTLEGQTTGGIEEATVERREAEPAPHRPEGIDAVAIAVPAVVTTRRLVVGAATVVAVATVVVVQVLEVDGLNVGLDAGHQQAELHVVADLTAAQRAGVVVVAAVAVVIAVAVADAVPDAIAPLEVVVMVVVETTTVAAVIVVVEGNTAVHADVEAGPGEDRNSRDHRRGRSHADRQISSHRAGGEADESNSRE